MKSETVSLLFLTGGFFGHRTDGEFRNFSAAHILPIVLTIALIFLIKKYAVKLKSRKHEADFRFYYGFFLLLVGMSYYWRLIFAGPVNADSSETFITCLPFQMCEWTLAIVALAMMKDSPVLSGAGFLLTMSTTLPALVAPATVLYNCGPAYFRCYQYFAMHLLPVVGVYYMMFVRGMRPEKKHILYGYIVAFILYGICVVLNSITDRFGYGRSYLYMDIVSRLPFPGFLDNYFGYALVYSLFFLVLQFIVYFLYRLFTTRKTK